MYSFFPGTKLISLEALQGYINIYLNEYEIRINKNVYALVEDFSRKIKPYGFLLQFTQLQM